MIWFVVAWAVVSVVVGVVVGAAIHVCEQSWKDRDEWSE